YVGFDHAHVARTYRDAVRPIALAHEARPVRLVASVGPARRVVVVTHSRVRAVGDGERARALGAEESACGGSVVGRSEEAPFGHVDRRTAADLVRGRTKRARRGEQIVRRDLAVGVSPIEGVALTELR